MILGFRNFLTVEFESNEYICKLSNKLIVQFCDSLIFWILGCGKEVPIEPTEAVFKKINKIFPADYNRIDTKKESKQKDAKEMLQNLSEMCNSERLSNSQRLEGQNLISSLAELLCRESAIDNISDKNLNNEDSGHSSITEQCVSSKKENHKCYEILDLRKKSEDILKKPESFDKPLDLSLKAKYHKSQSLSTQDCLSRLSDNKKLHFSLNSLVNNQTGASNLVKNKEKCKFIQPKYPAKIKSKTVPSKKGPLKAIIPFTETKSKSTSTDSVSTTNLQTLQYKQYNNTILTNNNQTLSKRTSTPIREIKLKPMAASTPIPKTLNEPRETKLCATKTRLSQSSTEIGRNLPSKVLNEKSYNEVSSRKNIASGFVPKYNANNSFSSKLSKMEMKRRNSLHETNTNNISKIKRSNSIGKITGLMTSLSRVRENLKSSPYFNNDKKNVSDNGNMQTSSSLPKMKILDKENILK